MSFLTRRRIERTSDGSIALRLPEGERELLASLSQELRSLLGSAPDDPGLRRLFPPAYDDPVDQIDYRELTHDGLLAGRQRTLESLERTASAERLDDEEAHAWLTALNDLRLVLGTRLDVQEGLSLAELSPRNPRAREYGVYAYLSWLQEQLVEALAAVE